MKRKSKPEHSLLQMIESEFKVMSAYIDGNSKCEIIRDGQSVSQHIQGPLTYEIVMQIYQNMEVYFQHLGSVLPTKLPRFVSEYNGLVKLCEEKRKNEIV